MRERPWRRRGVAPGEAGAIVGAHPRERRQRRLHARPAQRRRGDAGLEHHGGQSLAAGPQVEPVSTDADELAGWPYIVSRHWKPSPRAAQQSGPCSQCVDRAPCGSAVRSTQFRHVARSAPVPPGPRSTARPGGFVPLATRTIASTGRIAALMLHGNGIALSLLSALSANMVPACGRSFGPDAGAGPRCRARHGRAGPGLVFPGGASPRSVGGGVGIERIDDRRPLRREFRDARHLLRAAAS